MRPVLFAAAVTTALRLIGPIGRREVWTCGTGSSVVLTPDPRSRTPSAVICLTVAAHAVLLVLGPCLVAAATTKLSGPVATMGPFLGVAWLLALLLPLLTTAARTRRAGTVPMIRRGSSGRIIRMHDLARHPADPAGTGTRLLAAVLTETAYRADTVVAVAASPRLADRYTAAGMTTQSATTPTGSAV